MKSLKIVAVLLALVLGVFLTARGCTKKEPPATIPSDAGAVLEEERFTEPPGWQFATIVFGDGTQVRYGYVEPPGEARAQIVFFPGYSAPLELYYETFRDFLDAGYAVVAMDWPGQGGSSRPLPNTHKAHAETLDDHLRAADVVIDRAAREGRPLVLMGMSLGGQLATRLANRRGEDFAAAVFVAPAYSVSNEQPEWLVRAIVGTAVATGFGDRYTPWRGDWEFNHATFYEGKGTCGHDPVRMKLWYAWLATRPELRLGGPTFAFMDALYSSSDIVTAPGYLEDIELPVLMATAGRDVFIDSAVAEAGCERMPNCSLRRYEEAKHCLFEEADEYREPFMRDVLAFMNRHTGTATDAGIDAGIDADNGTDAGAQTGADTTAGADEAEN